MLMLGTARAEDLPSPPLLSDMISPRQVGSLVLSPDGKHIAGVAFSGWASGVFLMSTEDFKARRFALPAPPNSRTKFRKPVSVNWVDNDVLVVDFNSLESESIDLKGKRLVSLGERFIRRPAAQGPLAGSVLVYGDVKDGDIELVNFRTGERRAYRVSLSGRPFRRVFDATGQLRAVTMRSSSFWTERTRISNWYRESETAPWQLLQDVSINEDYWVPSLVLSEPNMLAVWSRHERDTYALFRYDTATKRHVAVMAGHPTEDIVEASGLDDTNVTSVTTHGLKPERYWFDASWAKIQASVDAALPNRVNIVTGNPDQQVLVASYSDVDPGRWFFLDMLTMSMREVTAINDRIDPKRMRPMETLHYTARDGLDIPAYLTRPARVANEPAPTVVLIHGGPYVRDSWVWNEEVQVLASHGYVVFQPQFRGSAGFGRRFQEAGYLQWGLAMQDDITDGVNELIRRKIADPNRICIYGASYGGYAALWGVIKTPTLYKCGASFAGVTDLEAQVSGSIFDDSTSVSREVVRFRVGDVDKRREQLSQVSPLKNAARVQVPLLIAHGEEDTRVLISQSERMVSALKSHGKSVEWMPFPNEGHGLFWEEDRKRYYAALLSFLQRHIGDTNVAEPAGASASAAAP